MAQENLNDEKKQTAQESGGGFSEEEKAAMKERAKELKREKSSKSKTDGEQAVLEKIHEMEADDKKIASGLHELIKQNFPQLGFKNLVWLPGIHEKMARSSPFSRRRNVLMNAIRPSGLVGTQSWMKVSSGRPPMPFWSGMTRSRLRLRD